MAAAKLSANLAAKGFMKTYDWVRRDYIRFCFCKDNNNFCITQKILLNFCKVGIIPGCQSFRVSQNKVFDGIFNGIENVVLVPE